MKPQCAHALLFFVLTSVLCSGAHADPNDLDGGVFIAHHPPGFQYSPGYDWCEKYDELYAISSCEEQSPRIDLDGNLGQRSIWYVIAAWAESKTWCGTEFGFGTFDPEIYFFLDWGACPSDALEISTANWPGPSEGVAISTTSGTWEGNFKAVYVFSGYAYYEGVIPLDVDPGLDFGGFGNCEEPSSAWPTLWYGAMGLFTDGLSVCAGSSGASEAACCLDEVCTVMSPEECEGIGGVFFPDYATCEEGLCDAPSATQECSWGELKQIYK